MKDWQQELSDVLTRAAALSVEHQVDAETFMRGAWQAYLESKPGMREDLEEAALRGQLQALRAAGRMAKA